MTETEKKTAALKDLRQRDVALATWFDEITEEPKKSEFQPSNFDPASILEADPQCCKVYLNRFTGPITEEIRSSEFYDVYETASGPRYFQTKPLFPSQALSEGVVLVQVSSEKVSSSGLIPESAKAFILQISTSAHRLRVLV